MRFSWKGCGALKRVYRLLCVLFVLLLCGNILACGNEDDTDDFLTPAPSLTKLNNEVSEIPDITYSPSEMKTMVYYTLSEDLENEEATAVLPSDTVLTAKYIVDYVVESMENVSVYVNISSVTVDGESVIIDFKGDSAPVIDTEPDEEVAILDSISQSILENIDYSKYVIFRVDGNAYQSQNRSFGADYIYLGK